MIQTEPAVVREVLPSGLTVIVETIPWVRSVALGYYLRTGSATETEELGGASHFLEHLVFKGTETRSTAQIASVIDELGGDVDAFTGKEYTSFYAHVLDEQVQTALDLLTDIVVNPRYTDADLEMERGVILEEIKMVEDTPDDLVNEIFVTNFWPDHPLGRPILGTEETVNRISRKEIETHYRETFLPSNMIFCASGNVTPAQIIPFLEKTFANHSGTPYRNDWEIPGPVPQVILREKKELEQVHLCIGTEGLPQQRQERYAAALFNTVLGGGMSSRLFQKVREKEGLVYSIASYHNGYYNGGYQAVYAACNPKNTPRVIELTLREMRTIRNENATAEELSAAKQHLKGSILLSLESTVSRMSGLARQEFYFGRQFTADQIIEHINAVTLDDIARVSEAIVRADSVSLTLLGNLRKPGFTIGSLQDALR